MEINTVLKKIDHTILLANEGYLYGKNRFEEEASDIFKTKILFKDAIFIRGEAAAQLFYDKEKFKRAGAAPDFVLKTLFGKGGIHGLDGKAHAHRKALFMSFMGKDSIDKLLKILEKELYAAVELWQAKEKIFIFDAFQIILFKAVCQWMGIPLKGRDIDSTAKDVGAMVEAAGTLDSRHWKGRKARKRTEEWLEALIEEARQEVIETTPDTVFSDMVRYRDENDVHLPSKVLAVELINIIRPTVAIARFLNFSVVSLSLFPQYRQRIKEGEQAFVTNFAQEVRRFFPFFPFLVAIVKQDFLWENTTFTEGTKVFLDIYGTHHSENEWTNHYTFDPDRFKQWKGNAYKLIPQGGGELHTNHRCPGEWMTIAVMEFFIKAFGRHISYEMPALNVAIDFARFPAMTKEDIYLSKIELIP